MTKTNIHINGDEKAYQVNVSGAISAQEALIQSLNWLYPKTQQQVKAALDATPKQWGKKHDWVENDLSLQLVAALIVAEADLIDINHQALVYRVREALNECGYYLSQVAGVHQWFCPDFYLYWEDTTEYWSIPQAWEHKVARIEQVRYFDKAQQVHACEFTPSYFVYGLSYRVVMNPGYEDEAEAFETEIDMYAQQTTDEYIHCRDIENLMSNHPERFFHFGNPCVNVTEEKDGYEGIVEGVREGFNANSYV